MRAFILLSTGKDRWMEIIILWDKIEKLNMDREHSIKDDDR